MVYATSENLSEDVLELASSKIDELTYGRIQGIGFNNLTPYQQKQIEKATLAQAEFYEQYGTDITALNGFSVGTYSLNMQGVEVKGVSSVALTYLRTTGLMSRRL